MGKGMRQMHVALGLIKQGNGYVLQLRDGPKEIGGAGLVGCFGGKMNEDEDPQAAAHREIGEETNLITDIKDWRKVGTLDVISDHQLETVKVRIYVYVTNVPEDIEVTAKEGKIAIVPHHEAHKHLESMTPGTRALFETYILGG